ncbi:MAG: methyltransferase domain-containing protein, partial [Bacteroidetes bacterium]|nr:methyltransferase domain-containing protein [Bacteroidota bacterium]
VICVDVLEHVSDLSKVIFEISRVLKNNGVFLFDTVNKTEESKFVMITILEDTLNEIPKGSHDWNKFIEPERLKSLLINTGFEEIDFKGFEAKDKDENTGFPKIEINDNISVMYIGKAVLQQMNRIKRKFCLTITSAIKFCVVNMELWKQKQKRKDG